MCYVMVDEGTRSWSTRVWLLYAGHKEGHAIAVRTIASLVEFHLSSKTRERVAAT